MCFVLFNAVRAQSVNYGFYSVYPVSAFFERGGIFRVAEHVAYRAATVAHKVRVRRGVRVEMQTAAFGFERVQFARVAKLFEIAIHRAQAHVWDLLAHFGIHPLRVRVALRVAQYFEYRFAPAAVTHVISFI